MYEISAQNHKKGVPYLKHKVGMKEYRMHLEQSKKNNKFLKCSHKFRNLYKPIRGSSVANRRSKFVAINYDKTQEHIRWIYSELSGFASSRIFEYYWC